jgi:glycosyltransferase involved in cell wall biosynthesis
MKNILLITHDTSLSGAPKSTLLVFEQLIKQGYKITTISLKSGGKLEDRFKDLSINFYSLDSYFKTPDYSILNRIKRKLFGVKIISDYEKVLNEITSFSFDYIYANTIVTLPLGLQIKKKINCKLILHVHELETVISEFYPYLLKDDVYIDTYIVPSELNLKCLTEKFHIPVSKINVIRETSDATIAKEAKIKLNTKISILMCGGAYWRKGDDLFLLLAKNILKSNNSIQFYWIGKQSEERRRVNQADIEKLGLNDLVFFIDETENPLEWYLKSDIFMLTSREDPFPLAAIDAGMLGLPIFCFEKATGISEIIDPRCVIPYLDIELMTQRILELLRNKELLESISLQNSKNFKKYRPEIIAKEIQTLLEL